MQVCQRRILRTDRLTNRAVESVDRTVALGGADDPLAVDEQLDRCLRAELVVAVVVDDHPERLELEERLLPTDDAADEQLHRAIGRFEVEPAVLELLQAIGDLARLLAIDLDAELVRLHLDGRPPGELRHHETRAVADGLRIDVLIGILAA